MLKSEKTIIQIIFGFILLCSLFVIAAGTANEIKLRKLRDSGIIVEGSVLDGGLLDNPEGIKTHYLKVEFQKENQEKVTKRFPVDHDDYLYASQLGKIPITYVPDEPDLSRVGTHYGYNRTPLYIAIAGFLFGFSAILVTQFLFNKAKNIPQCG